jgi:hypothetical protein
MEQAIGSAKEQVVGEETDPRPDAEALVVEAEEAEEAEEAGPVEHGSGERLRAALGCSRSTLQRGSTFTR